MPPITLRQASADDMLGCARVYLSAATDLARRLSTHPPQTPATDMASALAHLQRTDPRGFQVAERNGRVVAFASTILRGNTYFSRGSGRYRPCRARASGDGS